MVSELRYERKIQAAPPVVFRMFASSVALREWLCDAALVDARAGGAFFVRWNNGYYATGEFSLVQPNSEIDFTWRGKNDPDVSHVRVLLDPDEGNTQVTVVHSGLGEGGTWDGVRQEIDTGWQTALDNLVHVLEQGPDQRITNRPMLGVLLDEFSPETAERLNIPVRQGVCLGGVIEGMSAQKAGLQKDDVIVEIDGKPLGSYAEIGSALQGKRAGDTVQVVYYRGTEKRTADMELTRRKLPDMYLEPAGLAQAVEKAYTEEMAELERSLEGVKEKEAGYRPAESEWSIKEVLAHLIQNERLVQFLIAGHVTDQYSLYNDGVDNVTAYTRATVEVFESIAALMDELRRAKAETVALLRGLPQEFASRRSSMWLISYALLSYPYHVHQHVEQIQSLIEAVRKV